MPEYAVARQPFTKPPPPEWSKGDRARGVLLDALYSILNTMYGSDAIKDAPLDMMMPLGGMTRALRGARVFHGTKSPYRIVKRSTRKYDVIEKPVPFKHFAAEAQGYGAGGDLYGKGIYLTEHPKIAEGYAKGVSRGVKGEPIVRTHNIPPQAKILDLHKEIPVEDAHKIIDAYAESVGGDNPDKFAMMLKSRLEAKLDYWKKYPKIAQAQGGLTTEKVFRDVIDSSVMMPPTIKKLGYDGVSYYAGRGMGLPEGVQNTTRNYVIYNYDIINNPKSLLPKPAPKVNRGNRVGPIVNDILLPMSRKGPISPTEVTPFELQQLGLFKGAPPWKMGTK